MALNIRKPLDVWLAFDHPDDEEASHEANIYEDGDGFSAEWCHTAVGLVSARYFRTYEAASQWLIDGGYQNFSSGEPWWGACGVAYCDDCLPRFDAQNNEIGG